MLRTRRTLCTAASASISCGYQQAHSQNLVCCLESALLLQIDAIMALHAYTDCPHTGRPGCAGLKAIISALFRSFIHIHGKQSALNATYPINLIESQMKRPSHYLPRQ
ncbi:hypothetical protein CVIRNUC_004660 [Coccomyxa viridis]|uniref:Secreted protein n=1 Tax=Coccomyxa viridis TaxID=1274662 RepID=A0AAV1I567_9CHLO|nr:hypothetical protein CVIRNUC_004660 [Coccomyxa viridis]